MNVTAEAFFALPSGMPPRVGADWALWNRSYNPQAGRFLSMDAYAGNMGDPGQWMRYGYAGANPVANADPSGMMDVGSVLGAIGIGATYAGQGLAVLGGAYLSAVILSSGYQVLEHIRLAFLWSWYAPFAGELEPDSNTNPFSRTLYKSSLYAPQSFLAGILDSRTNFWFGPLYRSSFGEFGFRGVPAELADIIKYDLARTQFRIDNQFSLPGGDFTNRVENAARHLVWQMLLTLMYGRPFAEGVGEVHEHGEYTVDSLMDIHNNEVGRQLAEEIMNDPLVLTRQTESLEDDYFRDENFRNELTEMLKKKASAAISTGKAIVRWDDSRLPRPQANIWPRDL